jgi:hypothetical protein
MVKIKYSLVQDDSCHWYIIPSDKKQHWFNEWMFSEEYNDGITPDYVHSYVDGDPSRIEFFLND